MPEDQLSQLSHEPACHHDAGHGYLDNKSEYLRMVESDQYCIDILTQVSATTSALESLALAMLHEHLSHCVVRAARGTDEEAAEKIDEAHAAIARLVRS